MKQLMLGNKAFGKEAYMKLAVVSCPAIRELLVQKLQRKLAKYDEIYCEWAPT